MYFFFQKTLVFFFTPDDLKQYYPFKELWYLTNRPQNFPWSNTLIDHRNYVKKCSKLKWNHEPQPSGFTAKFWTFYDVISMVYKSVDHGKLWSICFFYLFFLPKTKQPALGVTSHVTCHVSHVTCHVIPMVYTLIDLSSRPISAQGFTQLL